MDVRERIAQGKATRVAPLAKEVGVCAGTIYNLAKQGKIETIRVGRSVLVPSHAARALLGLPEQPPAVAVQQQAA